MVKSDWIIIGLVLFNILVSLFVVLLAGNIGYDLLAFKKYHTRSLVEHQQWLFNQLYSMAPGKVLKPDEIEEVKSQPAKVINPNKDPMNEFNGKKTDYFA
jgi:hypothetical protein